MSNPQTISVIDKVNLPEFAIQEIIKLSDNNIVFPESDSKNEDETIERIGNSSIVLGSWNSTITKNILDKCPNIKYIGICGTSLTKVDVDEIKKRGIVLKNVTDYGDEATAEFIFSQLLNLFRGYGKYKWSDQPAELNGKEMGIIGLGAVGQQVARIALGFNMKVSYFSKSHNLEWENNGLVYKSLEDILKTSDIVSLHIPRNLNLIGRKEFALLKAGSIFVNTAIGNVFDLPSFIEWTKTDKNFAIIDNQEYIEQIKDLPNVIALPITAGKTKESVDRLGKKVVENLKNYLNA